MSAEVILQALCVAGIEKVHSAAEGPIFNSFMVRQMQLVGERWFLNMLFQPRPTRKSILARNHQSRVAPMDGGSEHLGVRGSGEAREKFPHPLSDLLTPRSVIPKQILRLRAQMLEVRI